MICHPYFIETLSESCSVTPRVPPSVRHVFYPPPFTCNKKRLERPKGVKDEVKQARRAKRVAEGHQLEIGAQRAPRFLVS